jgi:hypothetical protein
MKKHRAYFKKKSIYTLIYTDSQLADCRKLFRNDIRPYLKPERPHIQLSFQIMEEYL